MSILFSMQYSFSNEDPDNVSSNRIKGALYGHAIGDALGIGTKFLSAKEVTRLYPGGLKSIGDIILQDHTRRWKKGDWTEVTEQMLCVFDTLHLHNHIVPEVLAKYLFERQGTDVARGIKRISAHPTFLIDPFRSAKAIFERARGKIADNGALIRTTITGLWNFHDIDCVKANAEKACLVTHYNRRCADACIAVSCAIAALISGKTPAEAIHIADEKTAGVFSDFFTGGIDRPISSYGLNDNDGIGDSDKTFFAAFHVMKYSDCFLNGLIDVIKEGGDSTGNGAVAGAMLGARFGFSGIPDDLVKDLRLSQQLEDCLNMRPPEVKTISEENETDVNPSVFSSVSFNVLFTIHRSLVSAIRSGARFSVKLIDFLTGWITEDVYFVVNEESGEEIVEFVDENRRNSFIIRIAGAIVIFLITIQIFNIFREPLAKIEQKSFQDIFNTFSKKPDNPKISSDNLIKPVKPSKVPVTGKSAVSFSPSVASPSAPSSSPSAIASSPSAIASSPSAQLHKKIILQQKPDIKGEKKCPNCGAQIK
ncbi:MAG: ADP-ribosylglycohydrolase family protein [Candidatus Riflebacteria bacterium]|nr:ADP-ribosylglycohydrolase family protein [Candidatus Riflebacteria bacterium]